LKRRYTVVQELACSAPGYEAFWLVMLLQLPCVGEILPHTSAETSNAAWNLKEGAL
jgi:hypothetical protein